MAKPIARTRLRDRDRGWNKVLRQVLKPTPHVTVGVHSSDDAREGEIGNVELMAIQEFGSTVAGIQSRSVIRLTADKELNAYRRLSHALGQQIYNARLTTRQALEILGAKVASDMRKTIARTPAQWPPLKPATIRGREFGGSKPLLDTGELQRSIKHKVES